MPFVIGKIIKFAAHIVETTWFRHGITIIIILNAVIIGLDTSKSLSTSWHTEFLLINHIILGIFIVEAILKMLALYPRVSNYFRDGWNVFDFLIIVFSLLPSTGEIATIARLARVLRVLRLFSALPELRMLVTALVRSLPGMLHIVFLISIIFYVYGVIGYHLFHDIDPTHWRTLGISLLSLFRIVTLEDWTDIMYAAMDHYWWAWVYFVSFVVIGTFVVINLFIGIVITNLEDAKKEHLLELIEDISKEELMTELRATQKALTQLEMRLKQSY